MSCTGAHFQKFFYIYICTLSFQHSMCGGFCRPCMLLSLSFVYVLYVLNKKEQKK